MTQLPTVSVVIPNYNYGRFIAETIASALAQTYPIREVIVIDDGSTDDSIEVIGRFGSKVKLINQKNQGVGAARNIGFENSSGEFVAFLDADDIWLPNKIEEQMKHFTDGVGLVSCGMREFSSQDGKTIEVYLSDKNEWTAKDILLRKHQIIVSGSAIVVRRTLFEQVGGFDKRKELHPAEDWEFCYRMALAGKVVFTPKVLVDYRNHGNNGHFKTTRMERAMMLSFEKIFADAPPEFLALRRECYGDLYKVLAGDYFHSGNYPLFAKSALKGLRANPLSIGQYLAFPLRLAKRLTAARAKTEAG